MIRMESICVNKVGSEDIILKDQLFILNESHLIINCKKEIVDFKLNDISNVRFSKKKELLNKYYYFGNYGVNLFSFFIFFQFKFSFQYILNSISCNFFFYFVFLLKTIPICY